MIVYHGNSGKEIKKFQGYIPSGKKDRSLFGVGLYCSLDYDQATLYGRSVWQLDLYLDESKQADKVFISTETFLEYAFNIVSNKAYKEIKSYIDNYHAVSLSLDHCQTLIMNHDKLFHKKAQAINHFMIINGAKYTMARSMGHDMIIINDFSIIKSISKACTFVRNVLEYDC
ncbi:MAG: hypothetical protein ACRC7W_04775 [Fusobacteriaceae bacterium]